MSNIIAQTPGENPSTRILNELVQSETPSVRSLCELVKLHEASILGLQNIVYQQQHQIDDLKQQLKQPATTTIKTEETAHPKARKQRRKNSWLEFIIFENGKFRCRVCSKIYEGRSGIYSHLIQKHPNANSLLETPHHEGEEESSDFEDDKH